MKFSLRTVALGFVTALLALPASAQISYDPVAHAYFVTGDATIDSDVSDNEILVGIDNAMDFNTLPGTVTLTVTPDAITTLYGEYFGYPTGFNYYGINVFGSHAANIQGGSIDSIYSKDNSYVSLNGGTVSYLYMSESSTVDLNDGMVDILDSMDNSLLNMSGGSVSTLSSIHLTNISGGFINRLYSSYTGVVNVSGGDIFQSSAEYTATLNISGGTVGYAEAGSGLLTGSTVNITGGNVQATSAQVKSTVNIMDGTVVSASVSDTATLNISGGEIEKVQGYGNGTANITGGTISDIFAYDSSVFNLSGGTISADTIYQLSDEATINFFGLDVAFTNAIAGVDPLYGIEGVYYDTTWTRSDNVVVETRYFDLNGDAGSSAPQGVSFTAVPELGSLSLFGLAALSGLGYVAARRRNRSGLTA